MNLQQCDDTITSKLKFLYRKNRYLSKDLRKLLCHALTQPHSDYAVANWYQNSWSYNSSMPNSNKKYGKKSISFAQQVHTFLLTIWQQGGHRNWTFRQNKLVSQWTKDSTNVFPEVFLNSSLKYVLNIWKKFIKHLINTIPLLEHFLWNFSNYQELKLWLRNNFRV